MIAQQLHITNLNQIQVAEEMNIPAPDNQVVYKPFYFNLDNVVYAYITEDNHIFLKIDNDYIIIKYHRAIDEALKEKFCG